MLCVCRGFRWPLGLIKPPGLNGTAVEEPEVRPCKEARSRAIPPSHLAGARDAGTENWNDPNVIRPTGGFLYGNP